MGEQIITCVQCEEEFEFSTRQQEYFQDKGFDPPKRCPSCRKNKAKIMEFQQKKNGVEKRRTVESNLMIRRCDHE